MAPGQPRQIVDEVLAELSKANGDLAGVRSRRPDLFTPRVIEELAEAVRHAVRVDVERALRLAEGAVMIANELQHPESIGRSLRAKANALWFKNDLRSAVDLFSKAVTFFETAGREDEVGRTLSGSLQPLALLGEYDLAFKAAGRSAKEHGSLPPPRHILNAPTTLMKQLGYGQGYAYDHDAPDRFSGQDYFPEGMDRERYYAPTEEGFEAELKARWRRLAALRRERGTGGERLAAASSTSRSAPRKRAGVSTVGPRRTSRASASASSRSSAAPASSGSTASASRPTSGSAPGRRCGCRPWASCPPRLPPRSRASVRRGPRTPLSFAGS